MRTINLFKHFALFCFTITTSCATQQSAPAAPTATEASATTPAVGPSPAEITKFKNLTDKIQKIHKDFSLPAVQAVIFDRNEVAFKYSQGLRALNSDTPIKDDDKFNIPSAGKMMTALMIGQLIDQKLIDWDTPIKKLLSSEIGMNAALGNITIGMLLSQSSGLIEVQKLKVWPTLNDPKISAKRGRELLAKSILSYDPQFTPGSKTRASDSGYVVLGWILEKLTNFTWEELVKNKIFLPLGMQSCGFGPPGNPKAEKPDQPWGHTMKNGQLSPVAPSLDADFPRAFASAGAVHCSSQDWSRLLKEINLGLYHESFLMKEETFQKLLSATQQEPFTFSGLARYERIWSGGTTLMLSGSNMFSFSITALAPGRELALVVMINAGTPKAQEAATKILKLLTESVQ